MPNPTTEKVKSRLRTFGTAVKWMVLGTMLAINVLALTYSVGLAVYTDGYVALPQLFGMSIAFWLALFTAGKVLRYLLRRRNDIRMALLSRR